MAHLVVVLETHGLRQMWDEGVLMNGAQKVFLGSLAGLVGVLCLVGCRDSERCYGVEPDGEVEQLSPCPSGWKSGERRNIQEDQFKSLEVVDLSKIKGKGTGSVTVTKTLPPKLPPTKVVPTPKPITTPTPAPKAPTTR